MMNIQSACNRPMESGNRGPLRTIKGKKFLATLVALPLFIASCAQTLDKAKLDQFFDRLDEKNKAMGTMVIAKDNNMLYTRAIGYSHINATGKKPLTISTRYRIGSITKMFTAVMIMQLIEEGKLKLDDTLGKFFPQIQNAGKSTIAHILGHRSGIHDITDDRKLRPNRLNPITKDEMLAIIAEGKSDFEPGTRYSYSNSGFFVLGYIVEKLTGMSYQEALEERITSKIGLKETYAATGNIDVNKNESFSYKYFSDWKQEPETHVSILFGSGSLVSTAPDLARFIQALFNGKLVSQKSLEQMTTIKEGYGLGMDTFSFGGKTFYGHTGGVDGFGSWLAYLPEEKLAVVYCANGKVYPVTNIISGVVDIYYNRPFQIPAFETIAISPDVLDKYIGVYSIAGPSFKFTITRDGTTLYLQPPGQPAFPLEPTAQDKFRIESAGIVIEFDTSKNEMKLKRNDGEKIFTKEK